MQRIRRRTISEQVFEQILDLLKTRYQPGDQLLTEQELISQLGVSRTPIREALSALSVLGVVESIPGRGTFVRNLEVDTYIDPELRRRLMSHKTLRDLIEVRRMIEVEAAGLAAQRATKAHLHTLEKDVQRLADSLPLKEEIPEDIGFHLTVLQAADNSVLATLSKVIEEFYAVDGQPPNERDVAHHRAIYEAIRDGDAERARDAMAQHLRFVEDSLFRLKDSQSNGRERESS